MNPRLYSSAISSLIESATFESSEYDLINFGEGDRRLKPGDTFLGLGEGVRRIIGGLFWGETERPWPFEGDWDLFGWGGEGLRPPLPSFTAVGEGVRFPDRPYCI